MFKCLEFLHTCGNDTSMVEEKIYVPIPLFEDSNNTLLKAITLKSCLLNDFQYPKFSYNVTRHTLCMFKF